MNVNLFCVCIPTKCLKYIILVSELNIVIGDIFKMCKNNTCMFLLFVVKKQSIYCMA